MFAMCAPGKVSGGAFSPVVTIAMPINQPIRTGWPDSHRAIS
jgi:hypothetical protein